MRLNQQHHYHVTATFQQVVSLGRGATNVGRYHRLSRNTSFACLYFILSRYRKEDLYCFYIFSGRKFPLQCKMGHVD